MKEEDALLAAVAKEPDEDLPRLAFADWLDENSPDDTPTPAEGPSAWAEFVRVQCRLAAGAFDDPDYPELLEREASLGHWLSLRLPDLEASPGFPDSNAGFGGGEWGNSRRGFPEVVFFASYTSTVAEESVEAIIGRLKEKFAESPARTVSLEDAMNDEIALLVRHPVFARVRGLFLEGLEDRNGEEALAAIAASRWSTGLRRLSIHHVQLDDPICEVLAQSPYLRNLESLTIGYPIGARSVEALGRSKWFRRLRRLNLWLGPDDGFRALAALPAMRRLISLTLGGAESTSAGVKRFAASASFPALAHLDLGETHLSTDQVVALARGRWPLRHLRLRQNEVRKAGVEALVVSPFAPTLRVLELPWCEITASGVQELAKAEALANLRHLDLAENPIGPGGLAAIAASKTLSGLRTLDLSQTNTPRGPMAARDVVRFLRNLDAPGLRVLQLSGLPVGVRGARILATAPTFANLTHLHLKGCGIGETGTRHLVTSRTLDNLVVLEASGNKTGSGAGKLLNPATLPRLAKCSLGTGIPKGTATRLRRRAGIEI